MKTCAFTGHRPKGLGYPESDGRCAALKEKLRSLIIRMMVELMQPSADDIICDPACGTSGFLVAAGEYLKEYHKEEIFYDKVKKNGIFSC